MFDIGSDPNAPKFIPGYTGHVPKNWEEEDFQRDKCSYYIPKYQGFVRGIKAENIHGKTFGEATAQAIDGSYHKGFLLPADFAFRSTAQDAFEQKPKDYFFSFSRLTEAERSAAKEKLKLSMQLEQVARAPNAQKKIDIDFEQL